MADNVSITQGSGTTIATEDVSGIQHQKVKIEFGTDGVATMVSASDPLPVSATIDTTGLATDATDTSTASIDSKTPALGQALAAASVPVVLTAAQITTLTPPAAITGFATSAKQDTIIGHVDGIEGLLTTIDGDTGTIATEVAGLLTDTELRATPVPVSGTVTANLGATDNAVLDDIAADTEAIKTSLAGTLTVTGGGGGVEYTEGDTDATITGSALMWEDTGDTLRAVSASKPLPISDAGGTLTVDGTVAVTNAGITTIAGAVAGTEMQVDVLTMPTTTVQATNLDIRDLTNTDVVTAELSAVDNAVLDTIAAKDFATQTTLAAMNAKMVTGTDIGDVTINNSTGASAVNIQDGGNTITVDGTVTVGSITAGNNNIGDVDVASIAAGDNNIGNVDIVSGTITTVSTVTSVTAIANALPAGTNAIGKLAANSGVDIGDVTLTAGTAAIGTTLPPDIDVTTHTNYARKYYTNAGAVTDGIVWSPAAGKRWHVVTMYIQTSAAATITLEDDKAGGDDPVWKGEIAANSGVTLSFTEHYPMASGEDAADLMVTTSAGNIYITAVGYEI